MIRDRLCSHGISFSESCPACGYVRKADTEPYTRSTDGARMIAIEPGVFVNDAVWRWLREIR